jgi:CHAT domain-containing protein
VRPIALASGAAVTSGKPAGERPYAHPFYWAAFILIGDPN